MTTEQIINSIFTVKRFRDITKAVCQDSKDIIEDIMQDTALSLCEKKINLAEIYQKDPEQVYYYYYTYCWNTFKSSSIQKKYAVKQSYVTTTTAGNLMGSVEQPDIDEENKQNFEYVFCKKLVQPNQSDTSEDNYNKGIIREYLDGNSTRTIAKATGINYVTIHKDLKEAVKKIHKQYMKANK